MNEQIKEMAQLMCEDCAASGTHCPTELCDDVVQQAQVLYNEGWRKQSEVAREIFEEIHNEMVGWDEYFSEAGDTDAAHAIRAALTSIEKLMTKYTEGNDE